MSRHRPSTPIDPFWRYVVMGLVWGTFTLFGLWMFISVTLGVMN